jgi:hypoxanthine phosphoribosyltransferase
VDRKLEVLIEADRIASRVGELGQEIRAWYPMDATITVVGVLKGSFVFMADLVRAIDLPMACDFLGVRSYGDETESSGVVEITHDLSKPVADKDVLIVEDIVDTGLTMEYLLEFLRGRGPHSVRVCSLLHKPDRARVQVPIDFVGFTIPNRFVVGYGLDHAQKHRNLPFIGVIEDSTTQVATPGKGA